MTLGVLTLIGSVFGYAGARFHPVLLTIYLIVGTCATTLQLVLVIAIFGAQAKVADAIMHVNQREGRLGLIRQVAPDSISCAMRPTCTHPREIGGGGGCGSPEEVVEAKLSFIIRCGFRP